MKKEIKKILCVNCSLFVLFSAISCSNVSGKASEEEENSTVLRSVDSKVKKGKTLKVGKDQKYKTINDALKSAKNGDVIEVYDGEYKETLSVKKSVEIIGKGNVKVNAEGMAVNDDVDIINVSARNVTLSDLDIYGLKANKEGCHPCGIRVEEGSDNISILNCKIHDIGYTYPSSGKDEDADYNAHGIWIGSQKTSDREIKGVHINNCELYNLKVGNSEVLVLNGNVSGFGIVNNYIHDCDNIGIDIIGYEEGNYSESNRARAGIIQNNVIKNISSETNYTYDDCCAGGIYVDGGFDVEISNNLIINCDIGIELASEHKGYTTDGITVFNNFIYNEAENCWAGISIGGDDEDDNGETKDCHIANNTVYCYKGSSFVVQKANDERNIIERNVFIFGDDGEAVEYSEYEHFDNTHNTFRDNTELDVSDGYVQAVTLNENTKSIEITPESLIAEGRGAVKFN